MEPHIVQNNPLVKFLLTRHANTVNSYTRRERGSKGFSLTAGPASKYYHVAEYHSAFMKLMKHMLDLNKLNFYHTDLQSTRIVRVETDVQSLV